MKDTRGNLIAMSAQLEQALSRIRELEAELAEARRDGARARWYFDRKNASKVVEIELRCIRADDWWNYERWAQEIDAAMEGK